MGSNELCMICGAGKGVYSTNYAGKPNEKKGGVLPGNPEVDYLCTKCKANLDGGVIKQKARPQELIGYENTSRIIESETPLLSKVFYFIAFLGLLGGFAISYWALKNFGNSPISEMMFIAGPISGVIQASLFTAIGLGLRYLHNIHLCLSKEA